MRSSVRGHRRLEGFVSALLLGALSGVLTRALSTDWATVVGLVLAAAVVAVIAPWALASPSPSDSVVSNTFDEFRSLRGAQVWRNGRILWAGTQYRPERRPVGWVGSVYTAPLPDRSAFRLEDSPDRRRARELTGQAGRACGDRVSA